MNARQLWRELKAKGHVGGVLSFRVVVVIEFHPQKSMNAYVALNYKISKSLQSHLLQLIQSVVAAQKWRNSVCSSVWTRGRMTIVDCTCELNSTSFLGCFRQCIGVGCHAMFQRWLKFQKNNTFSFLWVGSWQTIFSCRAQPLVVVCFCARRYQ